MNSDETATARDEMPCPCSEFQTPHKGKDHQKLEAAREGWCYDCTKPITAECVEGEHSHQAAVTEEEYEAMKGQPTAREGAELKPCPFCGVVPRIDDWPEREDHQAYEIQCYTDHCIGPGVMDFSSLKVFTKWNTRVNSFREPADDVRREQITRVVDPWIKQLQKHVKTFIATATVTELIDTLALSTRFREWQPIEEFKEYGTFEVWLETPDHTLKSNVGIANFHPNATVVNGHFSYDMPKILYVRPLPPPPMEVKDEE